LDTFNQYRNRTLPERYSLTDEKRASVEPYEGEAVRSVARPGATVVEVGCVFGTDLRSFAKCGTNAIGLDLSYENAKLAQTGLKALGLVGEVLVADAEHLPFKSSSVDVAYSSGVLHHTPDIRGAVIELRRILKDGGTLLVMIYHRGLAWYWIMLRYGVLGLALLRQDTDQLISQRYDHTTLSRIYSRAQARKLFEGFSGIQFQCCSFGGIRSHPAYRYLYAIFQASPFLESRLGSFMFIRARKS
jgi:ubiquinone/menaquinone biosynthesis C-methylase UbiE